MGRRSCGEYWGRKGLYEEGWGDGDMRECEGQGRESQRRM